MSEELMEYGRRFNNVEVIKNSGKTKKVKCVECGLERYVSTHLLKDFVCDHHKGTGNNYYRLAEVLKQYLLEHGPTEKKKILRDLNITTTQFRSLMEGPYNLLIYQDDLDNFHSKYGLLKM